MTLTRELVQYFYPIYVTTSQKADICNGFQVITRTDTHTHTHRPLPSPSYMHVFMTTVWQSSQIWTIREASDRHTHAAENDNTSRIT